MHGMACYDSWRHVPCSRAGRSGGELEARVLVHVMIHSCAVRMHMQSANYLPEIGPNLLSARLRLAVEAPQHFFTFWWCNADWFHRRLPADSGHGSCGGDVLLLQKEADFTFQGLNPLGVREVLHPGTRVPSCVCSDAVMFYWLHRVTANTNCLRSEFLLHLTSVVSGFDSISSSLLQSEC